MSQKSVATADDRERFKNIPNLRPGMFFNIVATPIALEFEDIAKLDYDPNDELSLEERYTKRKQLLNTSLYTIAGKNIDFSTLEKLKAMEMKLWHSDNGEVPLEIYDPRYELRFKTVADCLWSHFTRSELKSKHGRGKLERKRLVILDHVYIGKESNDVINDEDAANTDNDDHELPYQVIIRGHKLNDRPLRQIGAPALAKLLSVKESTIKATLFIGARLSKEKMKLLTSSVRIDDDGKVSLIEAKEQKAENKYAQFLKTRLMALYNARMAGIHWDLNDLPKEKRRIKRVAYQFTFQDICNELTPHLKTTKRVYPSQIERIWIGQYVPKTETFADIEHALCIVSGYDYSHKHKTEATKQLSVLNEGRKSNRINNRHALKEQTEILDNELIWIIEPVRCDLIEVPRKLSTLVKKRENARARMEKLRASRVGN